MPLFCLNAYKEEGGQIFGLFELTYFMDGPLDEKRIRKRIQELKIEKAKLAMNEKFEKKLAKEGTKKEKEQDIKVRLKKLEITKFKGTH